jgi:hypothetical protein
VAIDFTFSPEIEEIRGSHNHCKIRIHDLRVRAAYRDHGSNLVATGELPI